MKPENILFVLIVTISGAIQASSCSPREMQKINASITAEKRPALWNSSELCEWLETIGLKQYTEKMHTLGVTPEGLIFDTESGSESTTELVIKECKMLGKEAQLFRSGVIMLRLTDQLANTHIRQLNTHTQRRTFLKAKRHHSSISSTSSSSSSVTSSPATSPIISPRSPITNSPTTSPQSLSKTLS